MSDGDFSDEEAELRAMRQARGTGRGVGGFGTIKRPAPDPRENGPTYVDTFQRVPLSADGRTMEYTLFLFCIRINPSFFRDISSVIDMVVINTEDMYIVRLCLHELDRGHAYVCTACLYCPRFPFHRVHKIVTPHLINAKVRVFLGRDWCCSMLCPPL